jgi:hypothetical protein
VAGQELAQLSNDALAASEEAVLKQLGEMHTQCTVGTCGGEAAFRGPMGECAPQGSYYSHISSGGPMGECAPQGSYYSNITSQGPVGECAQQGSHYSNITSQRPIGECAQQRRITQISLPEGPSLEE